MSSSVHIDTEKRYFDSDSYLLVNGVKIYQFKAKYWIKLYPLCLRNISKGFAVDNMEVSGANGYVHDFLVD